MEFPIQIIYVDPGSPGYQSAYYMARLAAELLEGELVVLRSRPLSILDKLSGLLPRKNRGLPCLFICPGPSALASILQIEQWREKFACLVAWEFDSFWIDTIPQIVRLGGVFDQVFVTEQEDLEKWRRTMSAPVEWLSLGS